MNIIVTGKVGIGKTTICEKVIKIAENRGYTCGGVLTYKALNKDIIAIDIQTGGREALASINKIYEGPHIGRYFFNPAGIELGVRAIDRGISSDILFVDEIGYLEFGGGGFANSLELIKAGKVKDSVLVIRKKLLSAFLVQMDFEWLVLEATISNRNELPQKVYSSLARGVFKVWAGGKILGHY